MHALRKPGGRYKQILRLLLEGDGLTGVKEEPRSVVPRDLAHSSIWYIKEGLVRRYWEPCGRSVLIDLHGPGSVVCALAVCDGIERLRAEAGSILVELPLGEMGRMGRKQPEVLVTLVAGLARHQSTLRNRLQLRSEHQGASRLGGLLLLLAEEIGAPCRHGNEGWADLPNLTHRDLADLLGCTRPHVSRLMRQLLDPGRLVHRKSEGLCVSPSLIEPKRSEEDRIDAVAGGA